MYILKIKFCRGHKGKREKEKKRRGKKGKEKKLSWWGY